MYNNYLYVRFFKETDTNIARERCLEKSKENESNGEPRQTASVARRKISCPMLSCKAKVIHLPRHMRNVHNWTKEAAAKVLSKYNIRKNERNEDKDRHLRRRCPIRGCFSVVLRLSTHLQKVHKLEKTSKAYSDAIKSSRVAPKGQHTLLKLKEQQAQNVSTNIAVQSDDEEPSTMPTDHNTGVQPEETSRKVVEYPVLRQFEVWLQTPDGEKRDSKTSKQHSSQMAGLLNAIDETFDIYSLLDLNIVSSVFLESYVKKKNYEAGTIKSYLMSLRHFYTFLLSDKPSDLHFNVNDVRAAREKVRLWSTSYKREMCTGRWVKLAKDQSNLLNPSDIQDFEKSEAAREAVKTIGELSVASNDGKKNVTQAKYILVRDFLLVQIFIDNANRPGVLSCMTMKEFNEMSEEGDGGVISVMQHKTAHIHGPAHIVLSQKLKAWLTMFVKVIRPHVTDESEYVFLTWNGQPMTSFQINKALQSVFKKATVSTKITSTSFRKAAVTNVHNRNPEMSGKLANLMAHNEATARKYYLLSEKTKSSVEASKHLPRLMRAEHTSTETERAENESSDNGSDTRTLKSQRVLWNKSEVEKIAKIFEKEIEERNVSLPAVRAKIDSHVELHGMTPRRVYDKLKKDFLQGKSPVPATSVELPNELQD